MARPKGLNLTEGERIVYGDKCLALKLAGLTYDEITEEVPVHRNTVGSLIRDAARRRAQDRDLNEEISRGIAIQRQLVEDLMRDYRAVGSGTPQRANARARLAKEIIKAQMNVLFLSGVEVPDPEQIIVDKMLSVGAPMPELSDLLSYPEMPNGTINDPIPHAPTPTGEPPANPVIPEAGRSGAEDADGGSDYFYDDWGSSVGNRY